MRSQILDTVTLEPVNTSDEGTTRWHVESGFEHHGKPFCDNPEFLGKSTLVPLDGTFTSMVSGIARDLQYFLLDCSEWSPAHQDWKHPTGHQMGEYIFCLLRRAVLLSVKNAIIFQQFSLYPHLFSAKVKELIVVGSFPRRWKIVINRGEAREKWDSFVT